MGHFKGQIGPCRSKETEDLGGQLGVDHQVILVVVGMTRCRRQQALPHQIKGLLIGHPKVILFFGPNVL